MVQLQARPHIRSIFKENWDFPHGSWSLQDGKWPRKGDRANTHRLSQSRNHGLFKGVGKRQVQKEQREAALHEDLLAKGHGEHKEISLSLSLDFRARRLGSFGKWEWLGAQSALQGAVQILICLFKGSAVAPSGDIKADVDGSLVYILCNCSSLIPQGNWSNRTIRATE